MMKQILLSTISLVLLSSCASSTMATAPHRALELPRMPSGSANLDKSQGVDLLTLHKYVCTIKPENGNPISYPGNNSAFIVNLYSGGAGYRYQLSPEAYVDIALNEGSGNGTISLVDRSGAYAGALFALPGSTSLNDPKISTSANVSLVSKNFLSGYNVDCHIQK